MENGGKMRGQQTRRTNINIRRRNKLFYAKVREQRRDELANARQRNNTLKWCCRWSAFALTAVLIVVGLMGYEVAALMAGRAELAKHIENGRAASESLQNVDKRLKAIYKKTEDGIDADQKEITQMFQSLERLSIHHTDPKTGELVCPACNREL